MKFEIKHRWSGSVLFSADAENIKLAVKMAIEAKAVLSGADLSDAVLSGAVLRGAVLSDAVLRGAVLRGADLSDAVLRGAVLSDAVLRGAVLSGADLSGADLSDADLSDAVLRDADLRGAVLSDAVLRDADLSDAVLSGADLTPIRDDFWNVLLTAPAEVGFLRKALVEGRVNGSTYNGECACLVGTIANGRKCDVESLGILKPNANRPAERFFLGIKPGGTPEKNPLAKLAVEWLDEFVAIQVEAAKVFGK